MPNAWYFWEGAPIVAATLLVACSGNEAGPAADARTSDASPAEDASALSPDAQVDSSMTSPDASGLGVTCSGASPSWMAAVTPIFKTNCSGPEAQCHGATALGPWPYGTLVGIASTKDTCDAGLLVTKGRLDESYLMNKITGVGMCPASARMPNNRTPLSTGDIQTIADWICAGAQND